MRKKIKQVHEKQGIKVSEEYIDGIIKDPKRAHDFMTMYELEKIDSMNYILGKSHDNKEFTDFELEAMSRVDLFDKKMIENYKTIWDNRDNPEKLDLFLKQINIELNLRGVT